MNPTIIFDFDGTLALGDGPISAFAREIGEASGDATFADRAATALAAFAAGEVDYRDGYDAVTRVAMADGVSPEAVGAAYDASRSLLGTAAAAVDPPEGLADFLARVGPRARLVLATNAPGEGVTAVLAAWGVADAFDDFHFTVGKPAGLIPVLRDALDRGPVLAVGDIVEFDLAPAAELGADTALVGATAERSTTAVTMRGRSLADLYDRIAAWAESAASPVPPPSEIPSTTERQN